MGFSRFYLALSKAILVLGSGMSIGVYLYYSILAISRPGMSIENYIPYGNYLHLSAFLSGSLFSAVSASILLASVISLGLFLTNTSRWNASTGEHNGGNQKMRSYPLFAVVFIAIMIIIGFIVESLVPITPISDVFHFSFGEEIAMSLFTILLQIIPFSIFRTLSLRRSKFSPGGKIGYSRSDKAIIVAGIAGYDILLIYFLNGTVGMISLVIFFILSDIIYLEFGLSRAFLFNFTYAGLTIISYAVLKSFALSAAFEIFMLIWILTGFLIISNATVSSYIRKVTARNEAINSNTPFSDQISRSEKEMQIRSIPPSSGEPQKMWIQGTCPVCGNFEFNVDQNAVITCTRCGNEISPDESHPHNIVLVNGNPVVIPARTSDAEDHT